MQILVVGNYCHDTLIHSETHHVLGGSAAYASSILEALDADYAVVSKVGKDFRHHDQVKKPPQVMEHAKTTSFIEDYSGGSRVGFLEHRCESIYPHDVAAKAPHFKVAMACAVAGEIQPDTLEELRKKSELLVCDVQGLIRVADSAGKIQETPLAETLFARLIDQIDFLKVGTEELAQLNIEELRKKTKILLTQEAQGCTLIDSSREIRVDGFYVEKIVDPSGAGDCFLAGFGYGLAQSWDLSRCVSFGNFCGSLAVSQMGVPKLDRSHLSRFFL